MSRTLNRKGRAISSKFNLMPTSEEVANLLTSEDNIREFERETS